MSLAESASSVDGAFDSIPVIDLANFSTSEGKAALAHQIRDACMRVGFFYISNHGIPEECISNVLAVMKDYFSLPDETKMKLYHKSVANFKGYSPLLDANIEPGNRGDLHEGFEIGWEELEAKANDEKRANDGAMAGGNMWPQEPAGFREAVLNYYHAACAVGKALFPLFALALDLPENYFDDKVQSLRSSLGRIIQGTFALQTKNSAAIMRAIHYPPQTGPVDDRVVGVGAHTDFECFTILWQQPGIQALQVMNSKKQWINAPPVPGTLVINIGDQFALWTNDVFKSTVHRAVNRNSVRRYSIPLFFGTDYHVNIEPIPSCISSDRPAKYTPITAGDYVNKRLKEMYH
ncbi:hypothetical protein F5I97DRAFT_1928422 [Phlebopus sp. FC_14]|nr:hypothetical protein F5I97DRAFT_1928422 [Phlebopus sp. FC_14]